MKTCVIVANGPSLADVPNEWLHKYTTFASNRVFVKEGFNPTYLSIIDPIMTATPDLAQDVWPMMNAVEELYLSQETAKAFEKLPSNTTVLPCIRLEENGRTWVTFSKDPTVATIVGHTVTYVMMQIAVWKGYERLLCVGLDHSFGGPRGDHVTKDYNKPGLNYVQDWKNWYQVTRVYYAIARGYLESIGGEIINLTPDTKLDVFPIDTWENYEPEGG